MAARRWPGATSGVVANSGDNTVTVVDASAHTNVATIPVGKFPNGISMTP